MKRWMMVAVGVVIGYVLAAALSQSMTGLMRMLFEVARSEDPPVAYEIFDLLYSTVLAGVGVWAGAWLARSRLPAYVLAGLSFVVLTVSAVAGWDAVHHVAYQWAAVVLTPIVLVLAGRLVPDHRLSAPAKQAQV